jgi:hypothetical protein
MVKSVCLRFFFSSTRRQKISLPVPWRDADLLALQPVEVGHVLADHRQPLHQVGAVCDGDDVGVDLVVDDAARSEP